MKCLIVYAHPSPTSINHRMLVTLKQELEKNAHTVVVRDLYAMEFNPVLTLKDLASFKNEERVAPDILQEQKFIREADRQYWIYPIWWTGLPAILKGYVDRVYSHGFAYRFKNGTHEKLFKKKEVILINTYGSTFEQYEKSGMNEALRKTSDFGIFEFCGIEVLEHYFVGSIPGISNAEGAKVLKKIKALAAKP